MTFRPDRPFNDLPNLSPAQDIETKAMLKVCIEAQAALAELRASSQIIPRQAVLINSIPLLEAQPDRTGRNHGACRSGPLGRICRHRPEGRTGSAFGRRASDECEWPGRSGPEHRRCRHANGSCGTVISLSGTAVEGAAGPAPGPALSSSRGDAWRLALCGREVPDAADHRTRKTRAERSAIERTAALYSSVAGHPRQGCFWPLHRAGCSHSSRPGPVCG